MRLEEEVKFLRAENAQLRAENAQLRAENVQLKAQVAHLTEMVERLTSQVESLTERLNQNSSNSNKPPSSDGPGKKKRNKTISSRQKEKQKKKRGGQPGHPGASRKLLPEEEVSEHVDLFPDHCENCARGLHNIPCAEPKRHQTIDLPEVKAYVLEFRRHLVKCGYCGHETLAAHDPNIIPSSPYGARLMSFVALATGILRLSRRNTRKLIKDIFNIEISLGAISNIEARVTDSLKAAVESAWEQVMEAEVKHIDGTSFLQNSQRSEVWTIASQFATVFKTIKSGSMERLRCLFDRYAGFLVSDRAKALSFWTIDFRQVCWAHLYRKFVSFSERKESKVREIGEQLKSLTWTLFEYWHSFVAGKISRRTLIKLMKHVKERILRHLGEGEVLDVKGVPGACKDILKHEPALFNYLVHEGVSPTNNHAEQELRFLVLWRKLSYGTQSERGSRYVESISTVSSTARKLKVGIYDFLNLCCQRWLVGGPPPQFSFPTS